MTTQSAYRIVLDVVKSLSKDYEIDVIPSRAVVAPFATCDDFALELSARIGKCSYDVVVIPGLVRGSTKVIEEKLGCRVYKGSKYAGDIPFVLELLESGVELSRDTPADDLYADIFATRLQSLYGAEVSSKRPRFTLGETGIYLDPPPVRLLLEVLTSDAESFEEKVSRAIKAGFDGIIVGCGSKCDTKLLGKHIGKAREILSKGIVGVDVVKPSDLPEDVIEEVDVVFNVTYADADKICEKIGRDKGVVVIPSTVEGLEESLRSIERAVSKLSEVGISKIVVDPLLRPPGVGFVESLVRFYYSRKRVNHPHLFSTANVYEMIDADSHGIIALLMSMAIELGASVVLATEESSKTYGAIEEHSIARYMAYASYLRKSPPKDVPGGLDLLILKEKRLRERPPPHFEGLIRRVDRVEYHQDPNYYVNIYVDHSERAIIVDVLKTSSGELLARFAGNNPNSLARAILREFKLIPEHAAYLGYELGKAELALKLRREYSQDSDVVVTPIDRLALGKDSLHLSRKKA